jgi:ribose-phosphate pyrophosphokinase
MIDTAGSVEALIRALAPKKPAEINLIAVHPVFSPPAAERLTKLSEEKLLNRIVVADTVSCPPDMAKTIPNLEIVPSIELSAKVIQTIVCKASMAKLLEDFNAELYLSSPTLF